MGMGLNFKEPETLAPAVGTSKEFKLAIKDGPFDQFEKDYIGMHWRAQGVGAKERQEEVAKALNRHVEDCRSEYRLLTGGQVARRNVEKQRTLVDSRTTEVYVEEKHVQTLFDRLSPAVKGLLGFMTSMGEPEEININMKTGALIVQFKRLNAEAE